MKSGSAGPAVVLPQLHDAAPEQVAAGVRVGDVCVGALHRLVGRARRVRRVLPRELAGEVVLVRFFPAAKTILNELLL